MRAYGFHARHRRIGVTVCLSSRDISCTKSRNDPASSIIPAEEAGTP